MRCLSSAICLLSAIFFVSLPPGILPCPMSSPSCIFHGLSSPPTFRHLSSVACFRCVSSALYLPLSVFPPLSSLVCLRYVPSVVCPSRVSIVCLWDFRRVSFFVCLQYSIIHLGCISSSVFIVCLHCGGLRCVSLSGYLPRLPPSSVVRHASASSVVCPVSSAVSSVRRASSVACLLRCGSVARRIHPSLCVPSLQYRSQRVCNEGRSLSCSSFLCFKSLSAAYVHIPALKVRSSALCASAWRIRLRRPVKVGVSVGNSDIDPNKPATTKNLINP